MGRGQGSAPGAAFWPSTAVLLLAKGRHSLEFSFPYPNSCPRRLPQRQLGDMARQEPALTNLPLRRLKNKGGLSWGRFLGVRGPGGNWPLYSGPSLGT